MFLDAPKPQTQTQAPLVRQSGLQKTLMNQSPILSLKLTRFLVTPELSIKQFQTQVAPLNLNQKAIKSIFGGFLNTLRVSILVLAILYFAELARSSVDAKFTEVAYLRNLMLGRKSAFKKCSKYYDPQNKSEHKFLFSWEIDDKGNVSNIDLKNGPSHSATLISCIKNVISQTPFSPAPAGQKIEVSYPVVYVFETSKAQ